MSHERTLPVEDTERDYLKNKAPRDDHSTRVLMTIFNNMVSTAMNLASESLYSPLPQSRLTQWIGLLAIDPGRAVSPVMK
jgi:hypothetical protein